MFRVVSTAVVFAVLGVTMAAIAQERADELFGPEEPAVPSPEEQLRASALAELQQMHVKLASLEMKLQRAQEAGQADRSKDLATMIEQVKSDLAKFNARGRGAGDTSDVTDPMQLREQISALNKEYLKAVNELNEQIAGNARVNELIAKLHELQGKLSAAEAAEAGVHPSNFHRGMTSGMEHGRGELDFDRGMGGGGFGGGLRGMGGMGGMRGMPIQPGTMEILLTPAQSQLEGQVHLLARQLAQSDEATQASVDKALRKVLAELYDSRLQQREDQLKQLEKRVADLRAQLDRQRQAKDEVIDLRVKTMINEAKGLGFLGQPATSLPPLDESRP